MQSSVDIKNYLKLNNLLTKWSFLLYLTGSGLNDGQWHEVRFLAKENFAVLTIDGDEASAVRTNSPLQVKTGEKYFFGGRTTIFLLAN